MSILVSIGALELCTNVMDFMGERILIAAGGLKINCEVRGNKVDKVGARQQAANCFFSNLNISQSISAVL